MCDYLTPSIKLRKFALKSNPNSSLKNDTHAQVLLQEGEDHYFASISNIAEEV